jgi:predicted nucleotidyltransferase
MQESPELTAIREALTARPDIWLAVVFGSVASGEAGPASDLDVAVAGESQPLSADTKRQLIEKLAATTGRPVDLVDLATAGEPLLGQIIDHGYRLIGSDSDYAELVIRHLGLKTDFLPYRQRLLAERRQAWTKS